MLASLNFRFIFMHMKHSNHKTFKLYAEAPRGVRMIASLHNDAKGSDCQINDLALPNM